MWVTAVALIALLGMLVHCLYRIKQLFETLLHEQGAQNAPFFLEAYVQRTWEYLGSSGKDGHPRKIAVFGAGINSQWVHKISKLAEKGPEVVAVIENGPNKDSVLWGKKPVTSKEFNPNSAEIILITSDTDQRFNLMEVCRNDFGDKIKIFDLYEGFPKGPFEKTTPGY